MRKDGTPLGPRLPKHLVRKAEWVDWTDEDEEDIRLIDFGEALPLGKAPARIAQPQDLRVPETIFTDHFDHRVDLWRAGCVVCILACPYWNMLTGVKDLRSYLRSVPLHASR